MAFINKNCVAKELVAVQFQIVFMQTPTPSGANDIIKNEFYIAPTIAADYVDILPDTNALFNNAFLEKIGAVVRGDIITIPAGGITGTTPLGQNIPTAVLPTYAGKKALYFAFTQTFPHGAATTQYWSNRVLTVLKTATGEIINAETNCIMQYYSL